MSVVKFELKEDHVKLLKQLSWSLTEKGFLISTEDESEDPAPFGANSLYEGIDLILNGKPSDFNPLETVAVEYTTEQIDEWHKLMGELPMALDIILYTGNFELGTYRTKFNNRDWKKIS